MINEIKVIKLNCLACGYEWYPRISRDGQIKTPKTCAKCKSIKWNSYEEEEGEKMKK